MFKSIQPLVFSFDVEWIPDPLAAARLFGCPIKTPGEQEAAMRLLWEYGGATPEKPQPYLKTILCRVVTLVGVLREKPEGSAPPKLRLISLPLKLDTPWMEQEKAILQGFFESVGTKKPQLVGYNSAQADVPILVQRAIVNGLSCPGFARRPEKPWEGIDYFSSHSDYSVDLAPILGRFGQMPALNEVARLSGIPGKIDTQGGGVAELWLEGRLDEILAYNECDALTTHLVWARFAHFGGLLSDEQYKAEQQAVRDLIGREIQNGKPTLQRFLDEWDRLEAIQPTIH
tara:strand:- start:1466 stop:2326 length:861 start_codon:yes stop_codon:yes gene_type:complete